MRFVEPTEGAYSLVVPDGWTVEGGVVREGANSRPWCRMRDLGNGLELRSGDPRLPLAFVEGGAMAWMGPPVRRYESAEAFATGYAREMARECGATTFEVRGRRTIPAMLDDDPRPDSAFKLQALLQSGADIGGVDVAAPDADLVGLVDVVTLRMPSPFGLSWSPLVTALVAPRNRWPQARSALFQALHSVVGNPAWQQGQQLRMQQQHRTTMDGLQAGAEQMRRHHAGAMETIHQMGERARISADAYRTAADLQQQGWAQTQASLDDQHRRTVNGIREVVDLVDPSTGTVHRGAPAGFRTYWIDGSGHVLGSHGFDNPDPSRFRPARDLDAPTG